MVNMHSNSEYEWHDVVVLHKRGSPVFAYTPHHKLLLSRQHVHGFIICAYFVVCILYLSIFQDI